MTGSLNGDMMPNLKSLAGNGSPAADTRCIEKNSGLWKNWQSTLQIDQLKDITVKDIKNYIEFANG